MGLQGVELKFATRRPTLQQWVAEATRLGGIGIDILEETGSGLTVAFSGFPEGRVRLSMSAQNGLFICDLSLVAPVLFQLLFRAGVSLGGHAATAVPDPSLQLPLTCEAIRKASRQVHVNAALGALLLLALLAAAVFLGVRIF